MWRVLFLFSKKGNIAAPIGDTIDVMDFSNPTDPTESITVAKMGWKRKHLSCALIPKGQIDNPTVAICKFLAVGHKALYTSYIKIA